jgi:hypothetical protein
MPDITITIKIPSAKLDRFREGFLYARPKEEGFTGTDKEWFEECVGRWASATARGGLRAKAKADEPVEDDYTA